MSANRSYNAPGMNPVSIKTKLLSLFILAFLCLSAGGAVCLAYCTTPLKAAQAEHRPLPKASQTHCPRAGESQTPKGDITLAESNAVSCYTLAINVFVAPIERKQFSHDLTAVASEKRLVSAPVFAYPSTTFIQPLIVRSLMRDRRSERIKNRVFRI